MEEAWALPELPATQAQLLPPEACVQMVPRWARPAERYARAVRSWEPAAHAGAVPLAAQDARGVRRQEAVLDGPAEPPRAAAWDAAAVLPQAAAWDVAGALRLAAAWDAELLPAGPDVRAARPLAAPSVFRRGQLLLLPARRRVARSAHAMRNLPVASPSELTWQAARCEGLS
jgi:hypothetical protein